jgi:hypothetical protein
MMPPGVSGNVVPMSNSGTGGSVGGNTVVLNINSAVSIMDEERARNVLIPMIEEGIRTLESRGVIAGVVR